MPLLFIPNFWGFTGETAFGNLELMDILIFPFFLLLSLAPANRSKKMGNSVYRYFQLFLFWAALSLLLTPFLFPGVTNYKLQFSFLKLAKFTLYLIVGYLIIHRIDRNNHYLYLKSLSITAILIGGSIAYQNFTSDFNRYGIIKITLYSAQNVISVAGAIFVGFMAPIVFLKQSNLKKPKLHLTIGVLVCTVGILLSSGRTGLVALLCGLSYIGYKKFWNKQVWVASILGIVFVVFSYFNFESFQRDVDRTIFPNEEQIQKLQKYNAGVGGLDDGKRLAGFFHELPLLFNNPVTGTGFFHRGGATGLMIMGSHNFWLQMALETGIIGLVLWFLILRKIWHQGNRFFKTYENVALSLHSLIIVVFISGMGGEFFYAGEGLMAFLLVYALAGSTIIQRKIH